jgi:hypothetical protein
VNEPLTPEEIAAQEDVAWDQHDQWRWADAEEAAS